MVSARGDGNQSLYVPLTRNGRAIEMHGTRIFTEATRAMLAMLKRACSEDAISVDDLALAIPHQANQRILDAVAQRIDVPVYSNIRQLGNTSSSTIPLALEEVFRSMPPGQQLGLCAFGGGFTFGAAVLRAVRAPLRSQLESASAAAQLAVASVGLNERPAVDCG